MAIAGGFLLSATIVREGMIDNLSRQGYDVDVSLVAEPVRGAIILADAHWALKRPANIPPLIISLDVIDAEPPENSVVFEILRISAN